MRCRIRKIYSFSHKLYNSCVDVVCSDKSEGADEVLHFIIPDDEFYLSSIRQAYNLKGEWIPNLNDYIYDFVTDLLDFPKLGYRDCAKGFIHKGFYFEPNSPFKFRIRGVSTVIDEYYSLISWERDVFNCLHRKASNLCFVYTSQYESGRMCPFAVWLLLRKVNFLNTSLISFSIRWLYSRCRFVRTSFQRTMNLSLKTASNNLFLNTTNL